MGRKLAHINVIATEKEIYKGKCTPIDEKDTSMRETCVKRLLETFDVLAGKCQGIAAPQVYLNKRAILVRWKKGDKPVIMFNPEIIKSIGSVKSNEACLSEGDIRFIVRRPIAALISWYDIDWKFHQEWITYRKARIFCHECDHLNGILLKDRVKENYK